MPTADVSLLLLKSTHSSLVFAKSGPVASTRIASGEHMVVLGLEPRLGLRTDIIRLLEVSNISGSVTNGRAMESTTCDATRRVLIPSRPITAAIIIDGTIAIRRVKVRRRMGYLGYRSLLLITYQVKRLTEIRHSMNPSATAWPAMVAIKEELCHN